VRHFRNNYVMKLSGANRGKNRYAGAVKITPTKRGASGLSRVLPPNGLAPREHNPDIEARPTNPGASRAANAQPSLAIRWVRRDTFRLADFL
jgi:hypothetical protein